MKLPSEYVAMLEEHCAKLEEIEDWLYEQWKATGEKETPIFGCKRSSNFG